MTDDPNEIPQLPSEPAIEQLVSLREPLSRIIQPKLASRAGVQARARVTGRSARTDEYPMEVRAEMLETDTGLRCSAGAPITVEAREWGVIAVAAPDPLPPGIEHRLADFTTLVATAIANAQARTDLTAVAGANRVEC
jgi:GAF domain-containing protein